MTQGEHVLQGYATSSLSLKAHPVSFACDQLKLFRKLFDQFSANKRRAPS